MKKTISLLLAVVMAAGVLFTGCGQKGAGESFTFDLAASPKNLDPQMASDNASLTVVGNIFEGLLVKEADGDIVPGVAEDYSVDKSGRVYTFYLREDATWSDADKTPVTADDFVFTFERLLNPATRSPYSENFFTIQNGEAYYNGKSDTFGVMAIDDHTLVISLSHPDPFFADLLTTPAASPCNRSFFTATQGGYGLSVDTLISNGPFRLTYWDDMENYYLVLKSNPNYVSSTPVLPSKVLLNIYPDYQTRQKNFEEEKSSCLLYETTPQNSKVNAKTFENTTWSLLVNTKSQFLSNSHIRRGIALATDKDALVDLLDQNYEIAGALVPPSVTLQGQSYRQLAGEQLSPTPNRKQAKQIFGQGLTAYFKATGTQSIPKITVLCEQGSATTYFSYISQLWQRDLGFFVSIESLPRQELLQRVASGNYDIALCPMSSSLNSVDEYLQPFVSGAENNVTELRSSAVDAAFNAMQNAASYEEKGRLAANMEQLVLDSDVVIPLYYQAQYFVFQSDIADIEYNPFLGFVKFKEAKRY